MSDDAIMITRRTRFDDLHDWLSVKESAAYTGLTPGTIYNLCHTGKIPCIRDGKKILIHKSVFHPDRARPLNGAPEDRQVVISREVRATLDALILQEAERRAAEVSR